MILLDNDRHALVQRARQMLPSLAQDLDRLVAVLKDQRAGYPTGGDARGGGTTSRTEAAALGKDPAREAQRQFDAALVAVVAKLETLNAIRSEWIEGPTKRSTDVGELGCEIVGRAGGFEPVYAVTDFSGELPRKFRLGRWAYRFWLDHKRWPKADELELHRQGRNIRRGA